MTIKRNAAAAIVALALATIPLSALAQDVPSYADPSTTTTASGEENIHGRVVNFNGAYDLRVRDDRGYIDDVQLHQGTIINPTGITLEPGMVVSILGVNSGSYLAANEIDTPYTYYGDVPYWDGHPWDWYGPSYGLAFYFDDYGWWRGGYRRFGGGGFHDGFHGGFHDGGGHFRGGVRGGEGFHGGGGHGGGGGFHGGGEGGFHGGGGHGGGGGGGHH